MSSITPVRRRRTAEQARTEILDAAEQILLSEGPKNLKFQNISKATQISLSTVHHHFGGILEIQAELTQRMVSEFVDELSEILSKPNREDQLSVAAVIEEAYSILSASRYAKLFAWLALESDALSLVDFTAPLTKIQSNIKSRLEMKLSRVEARRASLRVIYRVAVTALGEGIIGNTLKDGLGADADNLNGMTDIIQDFESILG